MSNQASSILIPLKWQEHFVIKRIDEEDIVITLEQRNKILESLNNGTRFVQINKYTLMLNSIKSIDPLYEPNNIPPRPKEIVEISPDGGHIIREVANREEIDLWDKLFGSQVKEIEARTNLDEADEWLNP